MIRGEPQTEHVAVEGLGILDMGCRDVRDDAFLHHALPSVVHRLLRSAGRIRMWRLVTPRTGGSAHVRHRLRIFSTMARATTAARPVSSGAVEHLALDADDADAGVFGESINDREGLGERLWMV